MSIIPKRKDDLVRVVNDDDVFTVAELHTLKKVAQVYSAGKIIGGTAVFICGATATLLEVLHYLKGH